MESHSPLLLLIFAFQSIAQIRYLAFLVVFLEESEAGRWYTHTEVFVGLVTIVLKVTSLCTNINLWCWQRILVCISHNVHFIRHSRFCLHNLMMKPIIRLVKRSLNWYLQMTVKLAAVRMGSEFFAGPTWHWNSASSSSDAFWMRKLKTP